MRNSFIHSGSVLTKNYIKQYVKNLQIEEKFDSFFDEFDIDSIHIKQPYYDDIEISADHFLNAMDFMMGIAERTAFSTRSTLISGIKDADPDQKKGIEAIIWILP